MTKIKGYRKITDRYGTEYRCDKCLARSEDETYIKNGFCHNPIIKINKKKDKNVRT